MRNTLTRMLPFPCKHASSDPELLDILRLIQRSFAYMDNRIDPPSSMHRLTLDDLANQCFDGEVWSMGDPPQACICLKQKSGRLYISKLAVDQNLRGHGFARQLITLAEERARVLGCAELELETRIELTENHHVFRQLGFVKTSDGAHDGFDRPTYIVLRKSVTD